MSTSTAPRKGGSFLIEETESQEILTPEDFDQESLLLAQTTRDFVNNEVVPVMDELEAQKEGLMVELLKKAGEIGLLCTDVPEAYGGLGVNKAASMLLAESLAGGGSFPVAHGAQTGIGTLPIVYFGTDEQKQEWLPKLATGEVISAYALTEADSGSDALAAKATAKLDGDEWVLNGEKIYITNGGFADVVIVFAKVDGEKFSAFIVPMNIDGVSAGAEEKKMGIKGSSTTSIILQDARIPKANLLGEIGKGHVIAFNILNVGRFKLGAGVTGGAKLALNATLDYTKDRKQFNTPLSDFPLSRTKLGLMASRIFASESAVYRTAGLMDEAIAHIENGNGGDHDRKVIEAIEEFGIECSIIKVFASEVLDYVVDETVQLFGGYGYVEDYPASRMYRDSRINRIYEGTNEINRMIIPGMMLKRAMKGELPLLAAAKGIQNDLMAIPSMEELGERPLFEAEMDTVAKLKKAVLLVAGVAAQEYGPKIQHEQEVLVAVADMIMETYALESSVLRAMKMAAANGAVDEDGMLVEGANGTNGADASEDGSPLPMVRNMIATLAVDCVERVGRAGREALAHISDGDDQRMQLAGLKRFTKVEAVDSIAARREVGRVLVDEGAYKLPA